MKNWDDLRFFTAVAREGSMLAASHILGVNIATVSRRIDRLEEAVGKRLFFRSNTGYTLSEDGERVLRHANELEARIFDLDRETAGDSEVRGSVVVTLTEALSEPFLIPLLPQFHALHPHLRIDVIRDDRSLNLTRREADIALRLVRPKQGGLKLRKIGEMQFGLYASPQYLDAFGDLDRPEQLGEHRTITWVDEFAGLGPIDWWRRLVPSSPVFRSNSPTTRRTAAAEGLGIALLPCIMVGPTPQLRRVMPEIDIPSLDIWLVVHRDLARHPRVRALIDFISEHAASRVWSEPG